MARFRAEILSREHRIPGHLGVITASESFPRQRAMRAWVTQELSKPTRGATRTVYLYDTKGEWTILDVVNEEAN